MNYTYIVGAVVAVLALNAFLMTLFLSRYFQYNRKVEAATEDEHTQCDCVGCASGCFECMPENSVGAIAELWNAQHYLSALKIPHDVVFTIIEKLTGTNKTFEDVLKELGYTASVENLSLTQMLLIDEKLYRCNVCGYWSAYTNPNASKFAALWKCPHCN